MQIAVFLFYINAFFAVVYRIAFTPIGFAYFAGCIAAGFGIANERRWGYIVGLVVAAVGLLLGFSGSGLIGILFGIALVALLLHPQSRDYQRIWFS
ncbi:MAG: hypothetical protein JWO68_2852 [Actinomycetia bacterium]|nr:hypothetical protein [Actinomycetes bacterium]